MAIKQFIETLGVCVVVARLRNLYEDAENLTKSPSLAALGSCLWRRLESSEAAHKRLPHSSAARLTFESWTFSFHRALLESFESSENYDNDWRNSIQLLLMLSLLLQHRCGSSRVARLSRRRQRRRRRVDVIVVTS